MYYTYNLVEVLKIVIEKKTKGTWTKRWDRKGRQVKQKQDKETQKDRKRQAESQTNVQQRLWVTERQGGQRIRRQKMIGRRQPAGWWLVLIIDKDHTIPQMIKLSWLPRVLWCVTDPWLSSTATKHIRSAFSSCTYTHSPTSRLIKWETRQCQ